MFIYGCSAVGIPVPPAALKEETTSSAAAALNQLWCCGLLYAFWAVRNGVFSPLTFCWLVNNLFEILMDFCHVLEVLILQETEYLCWYLIGWLCYIEAFHSFGAGHLPETWVGSRIPQQDCSAAVIVPCSEELAAVPSAPAVPSCLSQVVFGCLSWAEEVGQAGADGAHSPLEVNWEERSEGHFPSA